VVDPEAFPASSGDQAVAALVLIKHLERGLEQDFALLEYSLWV
jgi:hypothetical protein